MRKDKSVYSTPHCLGYMVKTAWKHQRDVLWRLMLAVACAVGLQAMQLYAAPEILASVERQDSISGPAAGDLNVLFGNAAGRHGQNIFCVQRTDQTVSPFAAYSLTV